jgi:fructose/tagatose bisphosphate aldolase
MWTCPKQDKIKEALNHGVIKFNIDTDIQVCDGYFSY